MVKVSVWLPNAAPGTELEVPFYGLFQNKTVTDIDVKAYDHDGNPLDMLVYGEPIPVGEEWTPQTPPSVFNTVEMPVIIDDIEEDGGQN